MSILFSRYTGQGVAGRILLKNNIRFYMINSTNSSALGNLHFNFNTLICIAQFTICIAQFEKFSSYLCFKHCSIIQYILYPILSHYVPICFHLKMDAEMFSDPAITLKSFNYKFLK